MLKKTKSFVMGDAHNGAYAVHLYEHSGPPGSVGSWVEWSILVRWTPKEKRMGCAYDATEEQFGDFEEAQKAFLEAVTKFLAGTYEIAPPCKHNAAAAFVD
jgi:hypothetical protein